MKNCHLYLNNANISAKTEDWNYKDPYVKAVQNQTNLNENCKTEYKLHYNHNHDLQKNLPT